MMEVVIVDDGNRLTVYELVERVIPCIIAKHYSENYIQGFRSTFRNLLAYCNKNEKKYFTAELAQQFMLDCYGVQPGTVERRCSRVHRAMDLLSDYQHFNAVMLRRRLNREFPAGLQEGAVNYLQMFRSLHFYERRNREIVFCGRLYQRIFRISTTTFSYAGSVSPALYMWAARVRGSAP